MQQLVRFAALLALLCLQLTGFSQTNQNITFRSRLTYPGQTLANICGYAADGREYALLGGSKGLIIVDVTNPDNPQQIVQIPGPDNLWKEIKTYQHYAYVTSEGGQGVQIVDLSNLPSPDLPYQHYIGDGPIDGQLNTIHALHIDTTKGFLYAYGSNLFSQGAIILDLNNDPFNPTFAGHFEELGYVHDGYVDNDTLYASHIYIGLFSIVDVSDKSNPVVLNAQNTPNVFTHNTWISKDRTTIFTTDEVDNSFLAAYNVSDPENIQFLDKIQSNPGSNSMVHNTHILGDYAVTSWYNDGVTIVDVSNPAHLVQVGNFDVMPNIGGGGSTGCWGVYPYLPSGTLVASVINGGDGGELWVLSPSYVQACYLRGIVTDANTGQPLVNVDVEILGGDAGTQDKTAANGQYKTGQASSGSFQVQFTRPGYADLIVNAVELLNGEITELNVALEPLPLVVISGQTIEASTGAPVPFSKVAVYNNSGLFYETAADVNGQFTLPGVYAGLYDIIGGAWGYQYNGLTNQVVNADQTLTIQLNKGYRDDFIFDYGWTTDPASTSATGLWERGIPLGVNPGVPLVPENDVLNDFGETCMITGNSSDQADEDDVESGTMILVSPVLDLSTFNDPMFRGALYFTSFNISFESLDSIKIMVSNGLDEKELYSSGGASFNWQSLARKIKPVIALTDSMHIKIVCYDDETYTELDSYEAAFDNFKILESAPVGTDDLFTHTGIQAYPNPFGAATSIGIISGEPVDYQLNIFDVTGRLVQSLPMSGAEAMANIGAEYQPGVYFARLEGAGKVSKTIKLVKTRS